METFEEFVVRRGHELDIAYGTVISPEQITTLLIQEWTRKKNLDHQHVMKKMLYFSDDFKLLLSYC